MTAEDVKAIPKTALDGLESMKFVAGEGDTISPTLDGVIASKVDWVPRDAYRVIQTIRGIKDNDPDDAVIRRLLFTVAYVGLMKGFDRIRLGDIIMSYLERMREHKRQPPPQQYAAGLAISSLLLQWIDEVKTSEIIHRFSGQRHVQDEDVRKLATYAGIEVRKMAFIARSLGKERVAKIADVLAIRLKKGVKADLVADNPSVSLLTLEGIGRIRARLLYESGFRSLVDAYSLIFNKGEAVQASPQIAQSVSEQLKTRVHTDKTLNALCRSL
ncbi:MAG: hypothetical protein M1587_08930 [Thaumarchaeota archaeon]|nr:hypothetical protein [Nitrososphaerota archaeon]